MLTVFEFLGIVAGAVFLLTATMMAIEKVVKKVSGGHLHRGLRVASCLVGSLFILCLAAYGMGQILLVKALLFGGFTILLNRYWLGHFSKECS